MFKRALTLVFVIFIAGGLLPGCRAGGLPEATAPISPTQQIEASTPAGISTIEPTPITEFIVGQPFDEFMEDSFRLLLLRDPESVTIEGLSGRFGVRNNQMNDLSELYVAETYALQRAIYDVLCSYDRAQLSPAQQTTYDTYAWYLEDLIRGQDFLYNDYPVNQMYVLGQQYLTMHLFTEYQPVENFEDAQDYVARLGRVKPKFDQLIESLYLRKQAGILAPRFVYQWSLGDVQAIASAKADQTSFYQVFREKLIANPSFSQAERNLFMEDAIMAINDSVIPGYQVLAEALQDLLKDAPLDDGVWQFENGDAYYAYMLRHFTSTEMSAEEIHQLGLKALERIHEEMGQAFEDLGYSSQNSLRANYNQLAVDSGLLQGEKIVQYYEGLIDTASQNLGGAFDLFPQASVEVDRIPSGAAFYSAASLDGSRPGVFYAVVGGQQPTYNMATVAYHEAIPGHHFQIALQREMDLPLFRNVIVFNAYAEGWALYAERLAWELGWYADDPYGNLGRLQYEAHRAARLVVDTGIHTKHWTFSQAVAYMVENTGLPEAYMQSEVARYIVWPGQATSYYIGYLKILELREKAQAQLGEDFDLAAFHRVVLGAGSVPLQVLEKIVLDWLAGG